MSEWISVKERMPEVGAQALVLYEGGRMEVMHYESFWGRGRKGAPTWIDVHGDDSSSYGFVEFPITHWMPVPELPSGTEAPQDKKERPE